MYEVRESRPANETLLEYIGSPYIRQIYHAPRQDPQWTFFPASHYPCSTLQKKTDGSHILADKHLSGTATNIADFVEHVA